MILNSRAPSIVAKTLGDEEATATTLLAILLDRFGTDVMSWDPATVELELQDEFGVKAISTTNLDKINALITALTTNLFYVSVEAFHYITNALNGSSPAFGQFDPVTAEEAAWAITEVRMNDVPEQGGDPAESEFSHEVRTYQGVILSDEGLDPFGPLESAEMPYGYGSLDNVADDPIIYSAVWEGRNRGIKEIEDSTKAKLLYTIQTIKSLPLRNADTRQLEKWLTRKS